MAGLARLSTVELVILLDRPDMGVHLPPLVWGIQYKYSADAMLMVLAPEHYDGADYIRDYDEYLGLVGR